MDKLFVITSSMLKSANDLIEKLGEEFFLAELEMTERNLRHIKTTGKFAGGWYGPISERCAEVGIICPKGAFNWKGHAKSIGSRDSKVQPPRTARQPAE